MLLHVFDSSYGDVTVEKSAAETHGVDLADARSDSRVADGVLVQYASITGDVMDAHPTWRVIGRYVVGVDTIDIAAATERGIAVVNVPDYCEEEVSTHAAALILAATRRIADADALVRQGRWADWSELRPIWSLSTATLALVGIGRIGRETIRLLAPFFGRVIAYDPFASPIDGVELVSLEQALAQGDVVSLHCPLTPETHHLVNAERLALMKPTAYLVNVSRGGLIDGHALAVALHADAIAGAALDVLETEPPLGDPLMDAPRVILTNHIAWYSQQSELRLRRLLAERCAAVLAGQNIPSLVNRAALEAASSA